MKYTYRLHPEEFSLGDTEQFYADMAKKSEVTSENLRAQIQGYLEDAARARTDAEIARREIERLNKEIASLKAGR